MKVHSHSKSQLTVFRKVDNSSLGSLRIVVPSPQNMVTHRTEQPANLAGAMGVINRERSSVFRRFLADGAYAPLFLKHLFVVRQVDAIFFEEIPPRRLLLTIARSVLFAFGGLRRIVCSDLAAISDLLVLHALALLTPRGQSPLLLTVGCEKICGLYRLAVATPFFGYHRVALVGAGFGLGAPLADVFESIKAVLIPKELRYGFYLPAVDASFVLDGDIHRSQPVPPALMVGLCAVLALRCMGITGVLRAVEVHKWLSFTTSTTPLFVGLIQRRKARSSANRTGKATRLMSISLTRIISKARDIFSVSTIPAKLFEYNIFGQGDNLQGLGFRFGKSRPGVCASVRLALHYSIRGECY